jgi:hypothetical protein
MNLKSNLVDNSDWNTFEVTIMEHCKNPWKGKCESENIQLYIRFKGEKIPICRQCWGSIADKELEW